MAVISFLFPIVGLIIWAVKKKNEPEVAAKCIKWAGYGVIANVALNAIMNAFGG